MLVPVLLVPVLLVPAAKVAELTEEQWATEFAGQQPVQSSGAAQQSKGKEPAWADEYTGVEEDLERAHNMFSELDNDLADAWASATRGGPGGEGDEEVRRVRPPPRTRFKAHGHPGRGRGLTARIQWLDPSTFAFADRRIEEKEYEFETENPFLTMADPFGEGMRLVNSGNLSDAALGTPSGYDGQRCPF